MGTKYWVFMKIKIETIDTGDWEVREGARVEKLTVEFCAHYLGDGIIHIPNLSIAQYIHVTNMHMYSLTLK